MIIKVTQEDIEQGQRRRGTACPVTLALRREHPEAGFIYVTVFTVYMDTGQGWRRHMLPTPVGEWIVKYDEELPVEPIEFILDDEGRDL